ncbi:MAG: LCP family protein [Candidatus Nanopelagicales bacterium]
MARQTADGPAPTQRHSQRRRILLVLGSVIGVVGLLLAVMVGWAYYRLNSNIATIDTDQNNALGDTRPAKENEAMNILAIGSDSREGDNDFVGGDSPGLADTTMVLHLAADNSWAAAVSIPRDSMVTMPDCVTSEGGSEPGAFRQFNEAYRIGGPLCVQRTVEATTGLLIDHFVQIDFAGFAKMVDALGGVTVYIPDDIDDEHSNIHFTAGCHTLKGKQALKYVRVRHAVDDGSDTARIKRQQKFMISLIQKVTSAGTLTNPVELYRFLDAATQSVTTDSELGGITNMAGVAVRVREIGLSNIDFTTVPTVSWPADPNRLIWAEPQAGSMWGRLIADEPLKKHKSPSPTPSPDGSPASTPGPLSPSPTGTAPGSPGTTIPATPTPTSTFDSTSADEPICPEE